jgi:hypothetical protein
MASSSHVSCSSGAVFQNHGGRLFMCSCYESALHLSLKRLRSPQVFDRRLGDAAGKRERLPEAASECRTVEFVQPVIIEPG